MSPEKINAIITEILIKDRRYHKQAYVFINEAVLFSANYFSKSEFGTGRHLSIFELLEGIREFTLSEFGAMSFAVLKRWGLNTTLDIGHVVFNLIDYHILSASPDDNLGDFHEVFDFHSAFIKPFEAENENPEPLKKIDLI